MSNVERPPEDDYFRGLWIEALWGALMIACIILIAEVLSATFR